MNHGTYQESTKLEWERFRELFEDEYLAGLRPRTRERYPVRLRGVTERTISLFVKGMRER